MAGSRGRAIVIGSGVESLVAACLLGRAGCDTIVLEKRDAPGGTRAPWPDAKDSGVPLLLDDVPRLHSGVVRELRLERHGAALTSSPASRSVLDGDGRLLTISADLELATRAIASFSKPDADAYGRFTATLDRISRALEPLLLRAPPGRRPGDLWTGVLAGRRYLGLSRQEAFTLLRWPPMPVADLVEDWFAHDPLRALVATHGLHGVFAGPRSAGTTAVLLLRAAADGGLVHRTPRVEGGVVALVDVLVNAARAMGVTIRTRAEVSQVLVERDVVAGVQLGDGSRLDADVVVSGIGPRRTLLDLLEPMVLAPDVVRRAAHVRARGTVARALLLVENLDGLATRSGERLPVTSPLHVVYGLEHLERAFDAMKYGGWAARPWLEVRVHPSTPGPGARAGSRSLSVTAHQMPCTLRGRDWSVARPELADTIVATLDECLPGLRDRIVACHTLTPHDFAADLGLDGGHPLHAELALDQVWIARPALGLGGYRAPVEGLYLCGPGTHPGVGPSGTSGLLASRTVIRDLARHRP